MTDDQGLGRWGGALLLVLAVHGGLIAATLAWATQSAPASPPPAALMIDLAPLPVAPPAPPQDQPPQVKPKEPEPPKPQKVERRPKPPTPKKAEIAVNTAPEKPAEPQPAAVEESVPPPSVAAPTAPIAAAPAPGPASVTPQSNALPTWQGALLAHLEKHKRYPRAAQLRRQQGVSYVAFTIDRQGKVLIQRVHKGSGHDSLDQETLDLLQRAQPLPPPPVEIGGERIDLLVPVQFFLK